MNANQVFARHKQYQEGNLITVKPRGGVRASQLATEIKDIRALQRIPGKKTLFAKALKHDYIAFTDEPGVQMVPNHQLTELALLAADSIQKITITPTNAPF
ncbi:hypothetical protein [Burkholderia sp. WAC0059]|uniref:hypothetical protein n=1 Tax=Burkholderia sp. WAC0059 TaxID=2066022 RepID=UPI0011AF8217|nr:hypothetical protein [Burkholderia sp. WAC0059]